MKIKSAPTKLKIHGFTVIEVLVILVVVIILAVLFLPTAPHERMGAEFSCINNLKQIGLALTMYADDNNGRFPLQVSATNTSETELNYGNHVFPRFQVASNELGHAPRLLYCPFDTTRQAATNFEALADSNISYFFNADAVRSSSTNSILSGDRFLENNGQPMDSGLFTLTTNLNISWTRGIHRGGGNVLWSDGSVQQTASTGLRSIIRSQLLATNHLLIP